VDKYFSNTTAIDVLLRTCSTSNNIVIGNGTGSAAIYVSNNSIGIQKIPNTQYAIDVDAPAHFGYIDMGNIQLSQSTISSTSNLYIDQWGVIQNNVLISNNILQSQTTLNGLLVKSISIVNGFFQIAFEYVDTLLAISTSTFLMYEHLIYKVEKTINTYTFQISPLIASPSLPFGINDVITLQVLSELSAGGGAGSPVTTWCNIVSSVQPNPYSITVNADIVDPTQMSNLVAGYFYSFGNVLNLLKLDSLIIYSTTSIQFTLKTIDKSAFPLDTLSSMMQLVLLTVDLPNVINETNVVGGVHTGPFFWLKNSGLVNYVNQSGSATTNTVTTLVFNNILSLDVDSIFLNVDGLLFAELSTLNTSYAFSTMGAMSYQLVGSPIKVLAIDVTNANISQYVYTMTNTLQVVFPVGMSLYVGGIICKIAEISTFTRLVLDTLLDVVLGEFLYVVPFQPILITTLGSDSCYIPNALAIGTKIPTHTLTVNGNMVVGSVFMTGSGSSIPFETSYTSNVFNMNNSMSITDTVVSVNKKMEVHGSVIADTYLSFSDAKIKKQIRKANPKHDLEMIKKIQIHNFCMKDGSALQKGVVAQELERLMPHVVHETHGYIPSICKIGRVTTSGSISIGALNDNVLADLLKGTLIQIYISGKKEEVAIEYVHKKKGTVFIKTPRHYGIGKQIYVYGPLTTCKTVDKDYLFMLLFNAVKALANTT